MDSTTTWFSGLIGGLYLSTGVLAHLRQPDNRIGLLMVLVGIGWFAEDLQVSIDPWVHTAGLLTRSASVGFLVHLVLAFPHGGLRSRMDRLLVVVVYAIVFGLVPLNALFYRTITPNLLLIRHLDWQTTLIDAVQAAGAVAVVAILVHRWSAASRPARLLLAPVFGAGLIGGASSVLRPMVSGDLHALFTTTAHAALILLPLTFLAGVWRVRLGRTGVSDLLLEMPGSSPEQMRAHLARALHDPTLSIGYFRPDRADYVDHEGRPVSVPPDRALTPVERDGRRVAALIHDPAVTDDHHVLTAVASATALELDNQRLTAEVRAQLAEVRASRARIVANGDEQRRRVERDLHDGAQQQLVTVALILRLARKRLGDLPDRDPQLTDLLDRCAAGLDDGLGALRELARGIHPAILTEAGLVPALRALAARCPQPVDVDAGVDMDAAADAAEPPDLVAAPIAGTAYFVAAEAVTNALKHACAGTIRVTVRWDATALRLSVVDDGVGGADPGGGTGLLGLRDRVHALDGTLTVDSEPGAGTAVHTRLPLEAG